MVGNVPTNAAVAPSAAAATAAHPGPLVDTTVDRPTLAVGTPLDAERYDDVSCPGLDSWPPSTVLQQAVNNRSCVVRGQLAGPRCPRSMSHPANDGDSAGCRRSCVRVRGTCTRDPFLIKGDRHERDRQVCQGSRGWACGESGLLLACRSGTGMFGACCSRLLSAFRRVRLIVSLDGDNWSVDGSRCSF